MEKYPYGFSSKVRLINHIEKREFSDKLRNRQRSFINLGLFIYVQNIVSSVKGIVSQDEYLLEGIDSVLSIWMLMVLKFLATFNHEVFACSIKTLTNPFFFFEAYSKSLLQHSEPPMTFKLNPNAAVILKIVFKGRPWHAFRKKWTNDREGKPNRKSYTTFGDGDGWLWVAW